jgi:hypothetical protein
MKTTYDVDVTQGIPKKIKVQYKEPDDTPKDLTGYLGTGTIKKRANDCEDIAQLTVTITNPLEGEVEVLIPFSAFENEKIKSNNAEEKENFVYATLLYKPNEPENTIELISGLLKVSPAITKIPVGV